VYSNQPTNKNTHALVCLVILIHMRAVAGFLLYFSSFAILLQFCLRFLCFDFVSAPRALGSWPKQIRNKNEIKF